MKRFAIIVGLLVIGGLTLGRVDVEAPPLLSAGVASAASKAGAARPAARPAAKTDIARGDDDAEGEDGAKGGATTAKDAAKEGAPSAKDAAKGAASEGGEEQVFPEGYAGDEPCEACHEEIVAAVKGTPHGSAQRAAWVGRGCEGCHGPGQAHVDDPSADNVRGLRSTTPATDLAKTCLACHGGDPHLRDIRGGEHLLAGVACTGCHDAHGPGNGQAMLKKAATDLCMSCHLDVRAAFAMPWRHGPREARIECGDCHDPHGSRNAAMMKASNDRTCFGCHIDVQGPWVFEHTALVTEGCASCHVAHGSANRHLLRFQQTATLCYQCHTLTPRSHVQPSYRDCTRCNVWVHGSNTDPNFLEP